MKIFLIKKTCIVLLHLNGFAPSQQNWVSRFGAREIRSGEFLYRITSGVRAWWEVCFTKQSKNDTKQIERFPKTRHASSISRQDRVPSKLSLVMGRRGLAGVPCTRRIPLMREAIFFMEGYKIYKNVQEKMYTCIEYQLRPVQEIYQGTYKIYYQLWNGSHRFKHYWQKRCISDKIEHLTWDQPKVMTGHPKWTKRKTCSKQWN